MEELVFLNGNVIPRREATISALDYGFLFGYALFETMRAYGGKIFRLDDHLRRLGASSEKLRISVDARALKEPILDLVRMNELKEARIRVTVSVGAGGSVPDTSSCEKPTVLITANAYSPYQMAVYERGFSGIISTIRRNSRSPLPGMKTANYLENLLARREAGAAGADEALLLNENGVVAEASASNFFLTSGEVVKTPPLDSGILPGITRGVVLELAARHGIPTAEEDIPPGHISAAAESFLTNSLIEVMPLTAIDGIGIGSQKPGPVTRQLMNAYKELVLRECG